MNLKDSLDNGTKLKFQAKKGDEKVFLKRSFQSVPMKYLNIWENLNQSKPLIPLKVELKSMYIYIYFLKNTFF